MKRLFSPAVARFLAISSVFLLGGAVNSALACESNLSPSLVREADAYIASGRSAMAYGLMLRAGEAGSGGAYRYLAKMFEQGRGVEKNEMMSRHMNWMGAQYQDADSLYEVAKDFYAKGLRKDGDYYVNLAKDCGHPGALVLLLERSIDERRDDDARKYLEQAIDADIPQAKFILAEQYDKGGLGLPKDHQRAFYWYNESAKLGNPKAMAAIAYYFFKGLHGVQDDVAALYWYHKAAKAGDVPSMTAYGWMLANGHGAPVDKDAARYIWREATARGDSQAAAFLRNGI
jgi:TPR repeat protein